VIDAGAGPAEGHRQGTLDDLGTPLAEVTFVVFDLETTGGSPAEAGITEIGAVKVRGGEVVGELATLVDPGLPIPPFVAMLTGITEVTLRGAPSVGEVVPSFLEFTRGCVLVAHNAPFDVGFMRAACAAHDRPWPAYTVVDTATLARATLTRDEVPNCKLATLAGFFRAATQPIHRALDDARATVDVLHGLIERLGAYGVTSLEELIAFRRAPTDAQRKKRHLADDVPSAPGVYRFEDSRGETLYIGKSSDLRRRVRSYFTAAETRGRVREMVGIAERVVPIVCATPLEAEVRELRLIGEHKPRYNRRSKFPERGSWIKLTDEPYPRLSIVRRVRDDGGTYLGPFGSSRTAERARDALHEAFLLRRCTQRISPRRPTTACVLAEMGRCGAPCTGAESVEEYAGHVTAVRAAMTRDVRPVVTAHRGRIDTLAAALRYEEAAVHRDRLAAFVRGADRSQRLTALAGCAQLVAGRPAGEKPWGGGRGAWELAVVRYGRLAAAGYLPPGAHPDPYIDALVATAETVRPGPGVTGAALAEEMECVLRWLEGPGVRLVRLDGTWSMPAHGAGSVRAAYDIDTHGAAEAPGDTGRTVSGRPLR
jgi:DNA polymerase-3 subunit epsilon